jgi:hypothetical protein
LIIATETRMTSSPDPKSPKKPYRRPKLTVYGDLQDITQTTMGAGAVMDMTTGMNKSG